MVRRPFRRAQEPLTGHRCGKTDSVPPAKYTLPRLRWLKASALREALNKIGHLNARALVRWPSLRARLRKRQCVDDGRQHAPCDPVDAGRAFLTPLQLRKMCLRDNDPDFDPHAAEPRRCQKRDSSTPRHRSKPLFAHQGWRRAYRRRLTRGAVDMNMSGFGVSGPDHTKGTALSRDASAFFSIAHEAIMVSPLARRHFQLRRSRFLPLDAFTELEADKTLNFDRSASLQLRCSNCLTNGLVWIHDKAAQTEGRLPRRTCGMRPSTSFDDGFRLARYRAPAR